MCSLSASNRRCPSSVSFPNETLIEGFRTPPISRRNAGGPPVLPCCPRIARQQDLYATLPKAHPAEILNVKSNYCNYFGPRGKGGSFNIPHRFESHARAPPPLRSNPFRHPPAFSNRPRLGMGIFRSSRIRKTSA